jgi:hypothetical protein
MQTDSTLTPRSFTMKQLPEIDLTDERDPITEVESQVGRKKFRYFSVVCLFWRPDFKFFAVACQRVERAGS